MEYPFIQIAAQTSNEDNTTYVSFSVQSEFFPIDETALAAHIQQWLLDNVPGAIRALAERREQTFPVTELPSLPA